MAGLVAVGVFLASFAAAGVLASGGEALITDTIKGLYVFGDSYVDTGNTDHNAPPPLSYVWAFPFGSTWPGYPTGRFSNGRVLTDYIVDYLGVKSPIPFASVSVSFKGRDLENLEEHVKTSVKATLDNGINFAYGGSGVFTTNNGTVSNVTAQIQDLKALIEDGTILVEELSEYLVLFAIDGNDYFDFISKDTSINDLWKFINTTVEKMAVDLEDLLELGCTNFLITTIAPAGDFPFMELFGVWAVVISPLLNAGVSRHNQLLQAKLSKLEEEYPNSNFRTLDLHSAFKTTINEINKHESDLSLGPCCTSPSYLCGATNTTVCSDANGTLFWDFLHPTQNGWFTVLKNIPQEFVDI